jgi:hypothetical protein
MQTLRTSNSNISTNSKSLAEIFREQLIAAALNIKNAVVADDPEPVYDLGTRVTATVRAMEALR